MPMKQKGRWPWKATSGIPAAHAVSVGAEHVTGGFRSITHSLTCKLKGSLTGIFRLGFFWTTLGKQEQNDARKGTRDWSGGVEPTGVELRTSQNFRSSRAQESRITARPKRQTQEAIFQGCRDRDQLLTVSYSQVSTEYSVQSYRPLR